MVCEAIGLGLMLSIILSFLRGGSGWSPVEARFGLLLKTSSVYRNVSRSWFAAAYASYTLHVLPVGRGFCMPWSDPLDVNPGSRP